MKREIKFNYLVIWDNGYSFNKTFTLEKIQNGSVTSWLSAMIFDKYHVRQFTGLKDKNGKEIYEGDILKHLDATYEGSENDESFIGTVKYDESTASFTSSGEDFALDRVEVIGNTYENSDLLKTE